MKSLMSFYQSILSELGMWCHTSTDRDWKTITRRVEHEGISFLTICLSDFGKDFQKSLDQGHVGHDQFPGFARAGGLPRFLGGFLDQVFDRATGRLLDDPSLDCIFSVRQMTLMFGKINLECSTARKAAAVANYIQCEEDVRFADKTRTAESITAFGRLAPILWGTVLSAVDKSVYDGAIIPNHGPGATADKLTGNGKWTQAEWTERLEGVFPHGEYLASSWRYFPDLHGVQILEPGSERPVRVITVPKTLKTPRIIAIEPTCMQYVQQGLLAELERAVEADKTASRLIGWTSQMPNQHLARRGSRDGTLSTLDLSEASDRVSNQLVRVMLDRYPSLREAVDVSRSRKADVPGYGVRRLAKFASMGSALTFPIEAMVFTTIVFVAIEKELNRPLLKRDVESLVGRVRTYGDDIIVPVEYVESVVRELEAFGLRVNRSKSFWSGKFRESCGKDYYDGHDVSVTRVRRMFPTHARQAAEVVSMIELRNQLYEAGLWKTVKKLDGWIRDLKIPFPIVEPTSPAVARRSYLPYVAEKQHKHTHSPLVKAMVVVPTKRPSGLDGYGALLKCLSKRSDLPFADEEHLQFAGRPLAVDTKPRWVSPF